MGNFTNTFTKQFEFDGDSITVEFTRMKNKHFVLIAPHLVPEDNEPKALRAGVMRSVKLVKEARTILKDCVVSISGLKDAAGKELSMDDIVDETYFIKLLDPMLGRLMEASLLKEEDIKKYAELLPGSFQESESSQTSLPESPSTGGGSHSPDVTT